MASSTPWEWEIEFVLVRVPNMHLRMYACMFVCLYVCLLACLLACWFVCPSVCLFVRVCMLHRFLRRHDVTVYSRLITYL